MTTPLTKLIAENMESWNPDAMKLARVTERVIDEVEQTIMTVKNITNGMLQAGILPSELANYACIITRLESALAQATAIAEGKDNA